MLDVILSLISRGLIMFELLVVLIFIDGVVIFSVVTGTV